MSDVKVCGVAALISQCARYITRGGSHRIFKVCKGISSSDAPLIDVFPDEIGERATGGGSNIKDEGSRFMLVSFSNPMFPLDHDQPYTHI